jgi:hypothetical protein
MANRTSWKKGVSGNPAGRPPRGDTWAEIARAIGGEVVFHPELGEVQRRRLVLLKVYELATAGDMRAVEFLALREDGPVLEYSPGLNLQPIRILALGEGDQQEMN